MKYFLIGTDRCAAVLDTLICLLPEESHTQVFDASEDDTLSLTLEQIGKKTTTNCVLVRGGETYHSQHMATAENLSDSKIKWEQTRSIKTAVYKAVCQVLPHKPVWGAQTGVKPAKTIRGDILLGADDKTADDILKKQFFIDKSRRTLCIKCAKVANACEASLKKREIQIYIGIAFCPAKCSYCSFVSNTVQKMGHLLPPYVNAVIAEIKAVGQMVKSNNLYVGSIYIGGGTPTVLDEHQLSRMLSQVADSFDVDGLREYSLEAGRPETINREKLIIMKSFGVDRISINPQSMVDSVLRGVGRNHTATDIIEKYALARSTGDFIINMDLIAGLPGDNEKGLLHSVKVVCALEPENITLHSLSRKKGAAVIFDNHYGLEPKTLDKAYKYIYSKGYNPYYVYRQKYIAGGLENTGFERDETINFYNVAMMEELCPIIAIGAGGVSKIHTNGEDKVHRLANPKFPKEYCEQIDSIISKKLSIEL